MPKQRKSRARQSTAEKEAVHFSPTPKGGHKWTIDWKGTRISARTSRSSVSAIAEISSKYAPALKRLAKR